eukprot:747591-Hanusia_phi.AAC.13
MVRDNRDRVEAMRKQLKRFQQITTDNDKEIKALRAERFKMMSEMAEIAPESAVKFASEEDTMRRNFSKSSFLVPHTDFSHEEQKELESKLLEDDKEIEGFATKSDSDSEVGSVCENAGIFENFDHELDSIPSIKQYKSQICEPKPRDLKIDNIGLNISIDYTFGYGVRGVSNNLYWTASRHFVYFVSSFGVVQDPISLEQRHFIGHRQQINCICLHPDGCTVATGEKSLEPKVYIWDSSSAFPNPKAAPIQGFHTRGIRSMAFGKDGRFLFIVGCDENNSISMCDWRAGQVLCSEFGGKGSILMVRCNPFDGDFATIGPRHMRFWKMVISTGMEFVSGSTPMSTWQKKLKWENGVFGRHGRDKSHTLLCVDFVGPGITITGTKNGEIFVWKGLVLVQSVQAHTGPIFSLAVTPMESFCLVNSGGKDGRVGSWIYDSSLRISETFIELPNNNHSTIRAISRHPMTNDILVGTSAGIILKLSMHPDLEWKTLVDGHGRGKLNAISVHSSGQMFVSGGSDAVLYLWQIRNSEALWNCLLPNSISSVAYSPDCSRIACGMERGGGIIVSQTPSKRLSVTSYKWSENLKFPISIISYSPDGGLLAFSFKNKIEIISSNSTRVKLGSFAHHHSSVTSIDWSSDGEFVVSSAENYELLFWSRSSCSPVFASSVAELFYPDNRPCWKTWTSRLGWPVLGLYSENEDENKVVSLSRDSTTNRCAVGYIDGNIRVIPYPCEKSLGMSKGQKHIGPVATVAFCTEHDEDEGNVNTQTSIVSAGLLDVCLCMWKVYKASDVMDDVDSNFVNAREQHEVVHRYIELSPLEQGQVVSEVDPVLYQEPDEFESVRPFAQSIYPPSRYNYSELIEHKLHRDQICGLVCLHGNSFLTGKSDSIILYAAESVCIVHNLAQSSVDRNSPQRCFSRHKGSIISIDRNVDQVTVASCDNGKDSPVLIWNMETLMLLCELAVPEGKHSLVSFSQDEESQFLVVLSVSSRSLIWIWDWRHQQIISMEIAEENVNNKVLCIAQSSFQSISGFSFVTAGINHLKLWKCVGFSDGQKKMRMQPSLLGNKSEDLPLFLSASFLSQDVFATGSEWGDIYLWKDINLIKKLQCHSGPIFAIERDDLSATILTAGREKVVKFWGYDFNLKFEISLEQYLDGSMLENRTNKFNFCIYSAKWNTMHNRITFMTSTHELFHFSFQEQNLKEIQFDICYHHKGKITALCCHPKKPLFVSGAEDLTVRLWAQESNVQLVGILDLPESPTAISIFGSEQNRLIVGFVSGTIVMMDIEGLHGRASLEDVVLMSTVKKSSDRVSCLAVSPCEKYLAAGSTDSQIYIYAIDTRLESLMTLKGHMGFVGEIDWDVQSQYLQSTSSCDELKFWSLESRREVKRGNEICDLKWASFTCRFGWAVQSCIPPVDTSLLKAVCRQNIEPHRYFCAGYEDGSIKMFPFPSKASTIHKSFQGISSHIHHLAFSFDDSLLVAASGTNPILEFFSVEKDVSIPETNDDIESIIRRHDTSKNDVLLNKSAAFEAEDDENISVVKPYYKAMFPPDNIAQLKTLQTDRIQELQLDHIYGYRGFDMRKNIFYLRKGEFATLMFGIVVIVRDDATQRYFRSHSGPVNCLAVHQTGSVVASSDIHRDAKILIWDAATFEIKQQLALKAGAVMDRICFAGPSANLIVALEVSAPMILNIYDYKSGTQLISQSTGFDNLLDLSSSGADSSIVTCGVMHLEFWIFRKGRLGSKKAEYRDNVEPRTMTCITFVKIRDSLLTATCSIDGFVFLWKENEMQTFLAANSDSIFDMWYYSSLSRVVVGCRNGIVSSFILQDQNEVLSLQKEFHHEFSFYSCGYCEYISKTCLVKQKRRTCENCDKELSPNSWCRPCIRSISMARGQIVIGTSRNEVLFGDFVQEAVEFEMIAEGIGHASLASVRYHPSIESLVFATDAHGELAVIDDKKSKIIKKFLLHDGHDSNESTDCVVATSQISDDGSVLIIGFSSGVLSIKPIAIDSQVRLEPPVRMALKGSQKGASLGFVKLCQHQDGERLVCVGFDDGTCELYALRAAFELEFQCSFGGLDGAIVDITFSDEGQYLMTSSDNHDLLFWELRRVAGKLKAKELKAADCRNVTWKDWTSVIGWPVHALTKVVQSEDKLLAVQTHSEAGLFASLDTDGYIRLMPFPALDPSEVYVQCRLFPQSLQSICISRSNRFLHVGSKMEGCLSRVKVESESHDRSSNDLDKNMNKCIGFLLEKASKGNVRAFDAKESVVGKTDMVYTDTNSSFMLSFSPEDASRYKSDAPDSHLELASVIGYRGHDTFHNLKLLSSGEVFYFTAKLGICMSCDGRRTQRILSHEGEVCLTAVHPDGKTILTVTTFPKVCIFVWNTSQCRMQARIDEIPLGDPSAVCFGSDGDLIAIATSVHGEFSVYFIDWKRGILLAESDKKIANPLLVLQHNPFSGEFVTAGKEHICTWKLSGRNLTVASSPLDRGEILLCIGFYGSMEGELMIAGNDRGFLRIWLIKSGRTFTLPSTTIPAHKGPVIDLKPDEEFVYSCDIYGEFAIWKVVGKSELEPVRKIELGLSLLFKQPCKVCSNICCVRGFSVVKIDGVKSCVFGLGSNEMFWISLEGLDDESEETNAQIMMSSSNDSLFDVHPDNSLIALLGADGTIQVWSREQRIRSFIRRFDRTPRALNFSPDGELLAVGFDQGGLTFLDTMSFDREWMAREVVKKAISVTKFSPDGLKIALGYHDGKVLIYSVPRFGQDESETTIELRIEGRCEGLASCVQNIDWSSDGKYIQSQSIFLESLIWDLTKKDDHAFSQWRDFEHLTTIKWSTTNCIVSWYSKGLFLTDKQPGKITSICSCKSASELAVGYHSGELRIFRFPCLHNDAKYVEFTSHGNSETRVLFSKDERFLFSSGKTDNTLCIWQHLNKLNPDVQEQLVTKALKRRNVFRKFEQNMPPLRDNELQAVPPFISSIYAPTQWVANESRKTNSEMLADFEYELEFVYGIRHQKLTKLNDDELIYMIASVVVLMNLRTGTQRFYRGHKCAVSAMALHPLEDVVATADIEKGNHILVWSSISLETIAKVESSLESIPVAMTFSVDGSNLLACFQGSEDCILSFSWKSNLRESLVHTKCSDVLTLATHPNGELFVTCGVNHIKFWKKRRSQLTKQNAEFGTFDKVGMLCVCFTEIDNVCFTITGGQNGYFYIWKDHILERTVLAHVGPILDMSIAGQSMATCGTDGQIRMWESDLKTSSRLNFRELVQELDCLSSSRDCQIISISSQWSGSDENQIMDILVLTSNNELVYFKFDGASGIINSLRESGILMQFHANDVPCSVSSHPSKQKVVSVSDDNTLREWNIETKSQTLFLHLRNSCSSVAYSTHGDIFVGYRDGSVSKIEWESSSNETTVCKCSDSPIEKMKFSPSGKYLACASSDGILFVLDTAGGFERVSSCKLGSRIESFDFSQDETIIQCNTSDQDLSFWSVMNGRRVTRAKEIRDLGWSTWSCRYGWSVHALHTNLNIIDCIQKAKASVLAVGLKTGAWYLTTYPCHQAALPKDGGYHGHGSEVSGIFFTAEDSALLSIESYEQCMFQWNRLKSESSGKDQSSEIDHTGNGQFYLYIEQDDWNQEDEKNLLSVAKKICKFEKEEDDIQIHEFIQGSVILHVSSQQFKNAVSSMIADLHSPRGKLWKSCKVRHIILEKDIVDLIRKKVKNADQLLPMTPESSIISSDLHVSVDLTKPYLSSLFYPSKSEQSSRKSVAKPSVDLDLEHVFGYSGENSFSKLILVGSGEIVFTSATVIIIHDIEQNKQSYFRRHKDVVMDISLHPNKDFIASVDCLPRATIFIWSSSSLEVIASVQSMTSPILCISFSGDGDNILFVANDNENRLNVLDWKKNVFIDKTIIEKKKILSMTSLIAETSDDNKFVTCGLDHVQFWSLVRGKIRLHPCYGDKTLIQNKHFIKAVFTSQHCVVAATDCGSLFIFRFASVGATIVRVIVQAHLGPIFDLWCNNFVCLTVGKDGAVRTWNVVTRVGKDYDLQYLKEYLARDSNQKVPLPSIRSLTFLESNDQIVIGTAENRLIMIDQSSHKVRWLNQGHSSGVLLALATHPLNPDLFLTGGSDCQVNLWDARGRIQKQTWKCRAAVFSVDFISSGESFAAGLSDGSAMLYFDFEEPNPSVTEVPCAFGPVRSLKFSPNKKMLAVGHEQGVVNVYEMYGRNCEHFFTFKGHSASVTEIDWDHSSRYLRSTSIALELFFWEVGSKSRVGKVVDIKDINWNSYNCTIGWYSTGLISSIPDERDILSSDASEKLSLLAVSRKDGKIQLLPFPCQNPEFDSVSIFGHLPAVAKVKFTCDSRRLISIGGNDDAVMMWRIRSTHVDQAIKHVYDMPESFVKVHSKSNISTDYSISDKEFLEIEFEPDKKEDDIQTLLQLHHVYGSSNLYDQKSFHRVKDKILFASASICVVHDLNTDEQEFYLRHQNFISSLAVHPDGRLVASGEFSVTPTILFWDLEKLETVAILDAKTMNLKHDILQVVRSLSFSATGSLIAVLCGFDRRRILIIDWAMKSVAHILTFETSVTECAFSHVQPFLVSCCQENVKFWNFKKETPLLRQASFGKNFVKQLMTSIAFVAKPGFRMGSSVQVTITGSIDGSIYLFGAMIDGRWKFNVAAHMIKAHDGPVMDVCHLGTPFGFASCGKDGIVHNYMLKYDLNPLDKNAEVLQVDYLETTDGKTIMNVQSDEEMYFKEMDTTSELQLYKTSSDQIIRYDTRTKSMTQVVSGARGVVSSISCHPDLPILAAVDRSGNIIIWESTSNILKFSHKLDSPLCCIDFSPDGGQIAVSDDMGDVSILEFGEYDCTSLFQRIRSANQNASSPPIASVVKFSRVVREKPYLAIGYNNGDIEVYLKDETQYRFLERTGSNLEFSHKSAIKALDWSFEPLFLRSVCLSDRVNIWGPLPSLIRHESDKQADRIQWFDNSCVSSYKYELLDSLKSTVRTMDRKTHITLNSDREIFLHNNPEKEEDFVVKCYACSSLSTKQIMLSSDNEFLYTFNEEDCCILAWRCLPKKELINTHLKAILYNMYNAESNNAKFLTTLDTSRRNVVQSRGKVSDKLIRKPRESIALEHVYGCNSSSFLRGAEIVLNRLQMDPTRENISLLYFSEGISILQNVDKPENTPIYLGLKNILCQVTSNDGILVATADSAPSPQIIVWRLSDRQVMKKFQGFLKSGTAILCFADQNKSLFSVCADESNTVAWFDLGTDEPNGPPLSTQTGGYNRIIAACSTTQQGVQSFITVGVNHIRSWNISFDSRNKCVLNYRKFALGIERSIIFCSVCTSNEWVYSGTNQGDIYLFKDFRIQKIFKQAHNIPNELSCPIFVLSVLSKTQDGLSLISGGGDGLVKFWVFNGTELEAEERVMNIFELSQRAKNLNARTTSYCKYLQKHLNVGVTAFDQVLLKESGELKIFYLVGTSCNELFLIDHQFKNSVLLTQAHSSPITCISAHPSKNFSASVSVDLTLRIWDNASKVMSTLFIFDKKPCSVAWSPKTSSEDELVVGAENGAFFCFTFIAKQGILKNTLARSMDEKRTRKDYILAKYSPDAKFLALGATCGNIDIFDVSRNYAHLGVCEWSGSRIPIVQAIDWSSESDILAACFVEIGLMFWKIHAEVSSDKFEVIKRFDISQKSWSTWSNLAGWFLEGLITENGCSIASLDCQQRIDLDEERPALVKQGSHDLALAAYGDSVMRLFRFPTIKGAKPITISHPSRSISQVTFANEGRSCLSASASTFFQWRIVEHRSDAQLEGQDSKTKSKDMEIKLREAFWQLTETDLDDLRRRGITSELRLVPATSLRNPRAKVLLFTFDAVALTVLGWDGRTSFKDPVLLNLASNPTWHEILEILSKYDKPSGEKLNIRHPVTFMYESFEIVQGDAVVEISEPRLKHINANVHAFELSRIKNESRRMHLVRNEFDFRKCWLWMEQEYRWLLSVGGMVPANQCFEISIYLTKNTASSTEDEDSGQDSDLELIMNECRVVKNSKDQAQSSDTMDLALPEFHGCDPTGWDEVPEVDKEKLKTQPKFDLVLNHLMGYSCVTCKDNVAFLKNDDIVYSVGSCAVMYERLKNSQRHFLEHSQKILTLVVDHTGSLVATGGLGRDAEFLVWNPFSLQIVASFPGVHNDYISALSFSPNKSWIVSAGGSSNQDSILVHDFRAKTLLYQTTPPKPSMQLAVGFNPNNAPKSVLFVSAGIKQTVFWKIEHDKLIAIPGKFGSRSLSKTMLSICFPRQGEREIVLTGGKDGKIYLWKNMVIVYEIIACKGPVFSLRTLGDVVFGGGKDNISPVKCWRLSSSWPVDLRIDSVDESDSSLNPYRNSGSPQDKRATCVKSLSYNGSDLLVGTSSDDLFIMNTKTRLTRTLAVGSSNSKLTAIAVHPSKPLFALSSDDGTILIHNTLEKMNISRFSLREAITAIAFAPSKSLTSLARSRRTSDRIAIGCRTGEFQVRDTFTFEMVEGLASYYGTARCRTHSVFRKSTEITVLAYSPCGRFLAVGAADGILDFYDVNNGYEHVQSCEEHGGAISAIDWSEREEFPLYAQSSSAAARKIRRWEVKLAGDVIAVRQIEFVTLRDEPWQTWTQTLGWHVQGLLPAAQSWAESPVKCVSRSLDHKVIACGNKQGNVLLFQFPCVYEDSMPAQASQVHRSQIQALAFTDADKLISIGQSDAFAALWDMKMLMAPAEAELTNSLQEGSVRNLCTFTSFSRGLKFFAAVVSDVKVCVWKQNADNTFERTVTFEVHADSINSCEFSSKNVLCTTSREHKIRLHDLNLENPIEVQCIEAHDDEVYNCCFSPEGNLLATCGADKLVNLWSLSDSVTLEKVGLASGHRKSVLFAAISDDSNLLCSASEDKTLRVWDLTSIRQRDALSPVAVPTVCRLRGHDDAVVCCSFSPVRQSASDNQVKICSGSLDGSVILWDVQTAAILLRCRHSEALLGCSFSVCGNFISSICLDNSLRLWNVGDIENVQCVQEGKISERESKLVIGSAFVAGKLIHAFASSKSNIGKPTVWTF